MVGYDSTEPYDGRIRFYRVLFEAGYDIMMMMMPTDAYVFKHLCIYMYYEFHVSCSQRHADIIGCISSISLYITILVYAFLPYILNTLFILTSFLFVDAACHAAGPDRHVDAAPLQQWAAQFNGYWQDPFSRLVVVLVSILL